MPAVNSIIKNLILAESIKRTEKTEGNNENNGKQE